MNNNILHDLGENFEYAKTIVQNEIELKKLDLIESSAGIIGMVISGAILVLTGVIALVFALTLLTVGLAQMLGSVLYALLVVGGFILLLGLLIFVFRRTLIIDPVINKIYQLF